MHAYLIQDHSLSLNIIPLPTLNADEILIEVKAVGINRADLFQVEGSYPAPEGASPVPGLEVAGVVAACGNKVRNYKEGDTVCALLSGGGYAEYVALPSAHALPIPKDFSFEQAACLPEALATLWLNLCEKAALENGQSLLIHAAASGIGTMGIQMAKAFGAEVFTTAGSEEKRALCTQLGAACAWGYEEDWVSAVKSLTGGKGVSIILDSLGGDTIQKNLKALAPGGKLINIAFLNGASVQLELGGLLMKNLTWMGTTLRSRSAKEKAALLQQIHEHIWPYLEQKIIKPVIDKVFPFGEAQEAHAYLEERKHKGKIVLKL